MIVITGLHFNFIQPTAQQGNVESICRYIDTQETKNTILNSNRKKDILAYAKRERLKITEQKSGPFCLPPPSTKKKEKIVKPDLKTANSYKPRQHANAQLHFRYMDEYPGVLFPRLGTGDNASGVKIRLNNTR